MARGRTPKSAEDVLVKSAEFVGWALGGLEREIVQTRERLAALNAQAVKLRARVGKAAASATAAATKAKAASAASAETVSRRQRRRQMSAEARERIAAAMKQRWAERRKPQE